MVNQGAITECLPAAPLPVCDSVWNPRLLVPEPRLGMREHAALSSPCSMVCLSAPHCLKVGLQKQHRVGTGKGLLNTKRK